jgi:DNA-directed RNA polymerase subunit RPC12/RpoP
MNPIEYTHALRTVAYSSWIGLLIIALALVWLGIVPFSEYLPFVVLIIGAIPIGWFMLRNNARCETCGSEMKISSGFPVLVYRCKKCGAEVNTGISSD